jgi:phosphoribosylaminoimidazole carboxylase PurE protein
MKKPLVGIVLGSASDRPIMEEAGGILERFGIPYEMTVASAHRSPERAKEYARTTHERGIKVIIAGAGGAAHLAGSIAAETVLPVIGVPIDSSPLQGMDALLATVQMPGGVPCPPPTGATRQTPGVQGGDGPSGRGGGKGIRQGISRWSGVRETFSLRASGAHPWPRSCG